MGVYNKSERLELSSGAIAIHCGMPIGMSREPALGQGMNGRLHSFIGLPTHILAGHGNESRETVVGVETPQRNWQQIVFA
jgi:hypothetical protein